MVSNSIVIQAWLDGHKAEAKNLSTDGKELYSYQLRIAANAYLYDYTSDGLGFISMTTSRHVGMARRGLRERSAVYRRELIGALKKEMDTMRSKV